MGRSRVLEKVQIGVETTPGTAVPANKRLIGTQIVPKAVVPVKSMRGVGSKAGLVAIVGKEHSEAEISGEMTFNDLAYLLAAHLKTPSIAANVATYLVNPDTTDTIKTLSVEVGQAARAEKFAYGFVADLQLRFTLEECAVSGRMLGRALTEGATLTATPDKIAAVPLFPKDWKASVGAAADFSDLAVLTGCLEAEWMSRNIRRMAFYADPTQDSFKEPLELAPDMSIRLLLEHDSAASAFMANLRAGDKRYVRIKGTSPAEAAEAVPYDLEISMPFVFQESDRSDSEDVRGISYTLIPQLDDTLASFLQIKLATTVTF